MTGIVPDSPPPTMSYNTIIIHGPHGCGKNSRAEALAKHFGCEPTIEKDFAPKRSELVAGRLHLSNVPIEQFYYCKNGVYAHVYEYNAALQFMNSGKQL